jgi:hypothetical protein
MSSIAFKIVNIYSEKQYIIFFLPYSQSSFFATLALGDEQYVFFYF